MNTIEIKRGDTFILENRVTADGAPQNMTAWGVRAHLRRGGTLISDLTVQWINRASGIYRLVETATQGWPVGTLTCDIEYTLSSAQVVSTETFEVECLRDETL